MILMEHWLIWSEDWRLKITSELDTTYLAVLFFYFVTCPCSLRTKRRDNLLVCDDDDDDDDDRPTFDFTVF